MGDFYPVNKYYLCIIFVFIFTGCASTAPILRTPDVSGEYYQVTFMAYSSGTINSSGQKSYSGHAAVSIDRTGAWGFYPSREGKPITARGLLKYSDRYPRTQEYADFFVDAHIMGEIRELIARWEADPPAFILPASDCVSFIDRICDIIGLRYNRLAVLPVWAVRDIRSSNDQNTVYKGQ
jgi:hypothetical protein